MMSDRHSSFLVAGLATLLAAAAPLGRVPPAAVEDSSSRLTIPVMIDGKGPYAFVVDTGASRTVISRELASTLGLPPGPTVSMDDSLGRLSVATAIIDHLDVGGRGISRIDAPLLAAADLGAAGMLGIDSLQNQILVFDFSQKRFHLDPSPPSDSFNTTIVEGRRRFGQLVLVDAESHAVPIFVILDSGAQNTIGNAALRHLMLGSPHAGELPIDTLISVSGSRTQAELDVMPEIQLGGITIRNAPIAYAALHTFEQFGLEHRPALLLGMDVLHMFRQVSIDFRRKEAVFVTE